MPNRGISCPHHVRSVGIVPSPETKPEADGEAEAEAEPWCQLPSSPLPSIQSQWCRVSASLGGGFAIGIGKIGWLRAWFKVTGKG